MTAVAPLAAAELAALDVAVDAAVDAVLELCRRRAAVLGSVADQTRPPDPVPLSGHLAGLLDQLQPATPPSPAEGDLWLLRQEALWAAHALRVEVARRIDADIAATLTGPPTARP